MTENTDVNANFLNKDWWKIATVEDVEAEIAKGADVNARNMFGETPLMHAASNNKNPKIIKTLVKLDADVNVEDSEGWTPLMYAAKYNENPEIIKTLVEFGAEINAKDDELFFIPLAWAAGSNKNPEIIKTLVELGADINDPGILDWTPLLLAARFNENPEIIKTLVELGADINAKGNEGKTALDYAKENKNPEIHKLLEEYSANPINKCSEKRNKMIDQVIRDMKVGKIVQKYLIPAIREGKVSEYELNKFREDGYSKQIFNINYPLLSKNRIVDGYSRYYCDKKMVTIGREKYYVCQEWYEYSKNQLLKWLQEHSAL